MAIYLGTGNLNEIETFQNMGILRGVTTNPTILLKDGVKGEMDGIKERTEEIANMISTTTFSRSFKQ